MDGGGMEGWRRVGIGRIEDGWGKDGGWIVKGEGRRGEEWKRDRRRTKEGWGDGLKRNWGG